MPAETCIMGLFSDDGKAARAIQGLAPAGFSFRRAHSPFPSHKIMEVLKLRKGRVGWFTLAGGILGFLSGFALAIYCAVQWNLIASGKPIVALIPFVIVGFEFTILFSVFGNVIGLLVCSRLPDYKGLELYDPRCSGDLFGVLASCESNRRGELMGFFQKQGGEVKVFE